MASGREPQERLYLSSDDEVDYEPHSKRKKLSTPTAGTSSSAVCDVENMPPNPELLRLENKLKAFAKDITKAFPWTKFGSNRDAFCYRRVRGHLNVFKRECLEQCKVFVDAKQWKQAIKYILIAWQYVDQLPRWDDPKHNKLNEQCYKKLSSYLANSLKKEKEFEKRELQSYIGRFKNLIEDSDSESDDVKNNGMQNSIKVAEAILKKMN